MRHPRGVTRPTRGHGPVFGHPGSVETRPGDAERLRLSGLAVVASSCSSVRVWGPRSRGSLRLAHSLVATLRVAPWPFPLRILWLKTRPPPPARAHAPAKDPKKPPTRAQRGRGSLPASRSLARRRIEGGEALEPCARLRSPQRRPDEAWSWRGLRKASSERPRWRRLLLFAELLPKRQAFTRNERRSRPGQVPQSFQKRFPGSYPKGSARLLLPSPGTGTQGRCPPQKHPLATHFLHRRRLISGSPTLPPGAGGCLGLAPPPPGARGAGKSIRAVSQRRFCRRLTPRCPRGGSRSPRGGPASVGRTRRGRP